MQIGLVGMPQSGKTTLFNLLTGSDHLIGFSGSDEVHIGSTPVPDSRVDYLASLYKPRKITYARIEFKDIPGARMDDSSARAARLLDEVRNADMLVQVIRAFNTDEVHSTSGKPDPYRDLTNYGTELLLADLDAVEKRITRLKSATKAKKDNPAQIAILEKLQAELERENLLKNIKITEQEVQLLAGQNFLSEKPLIVVVNLDESQLNAGDYPDRDKILAYAESNGIPVIEICALVEMEISRLLPAERVEFMEDLGLTEIGLSRLARTAYERLDLISFFTIGSDEVRAWTIEKGTSARHAAGKVHSDIERGFIRAEIFHYDHLEQWGNAAKVREMGLFRLEGKDYPVKDGDIINFRFNI